MLTPGAHPDSPILSGIKYSVKVVLDNFYNTDILYLSYVDLETITNEKWTVLIQKIKISVNINNIKLILLDKTGDPDILNKISYNSPSSLEMLDDLSKIVSSHIITEDYYYFYNPTPNVIFFPYQLWIFNTKNIHKYYPYKFTQYDTSLTKTKSIMCLNRNLAWHRLFLFSLIVEKSWFDKINYSFLNKLNNRLTHPAIKLFLTNEDCDLIQSYDFLLPIKLKNEKDINQLPFMYWNGGGSIDTPVYTENAINLITETSLTEGVVITEKTCKSFMSYQIPIIVGPVGVNKFLEDVGLDMFSDYVPWKIWDNETDHKLKIKKIVEFLDQLLSSPSAEQDILSTHQSFHTRLIKNKEYFHSKELENILLAQIKS